MTLTPSWDNLKLRDNVRDDVVLPTIIIDPPFHGDQVGWDEPEEVIQ